VYNVYREVISLRNFKLDEIKRKADSAESKLMEEKIKILVKSQPNYASGRKRPKDALEAQILLKLKSGS
jgi:hypothetical protein